MIKGEALTMNQGQNQTMIRDRYGVIFCFFLYHGRTTWYNVASNLLVF
jgi:hypothetical protein